MTSYEFSSQIKVMIDELKALCASVGLNNTGNEYKVISELFAYKFLSDKINFMKKQNDYDSWEEFLFYLDEKTAKMEENETVEALFNQQNQINFHEILDSTLVSISDRNKEVYAIETAGGQLKGLFDPISPYIMDTDKKIGFARGAINVLAQADFQGMFDEKFDYFAVIFEYLIKDYNSNSGAYAEFYTPSFTADIIAQLLLDNNNPNNVRCYDPAAGSGTLLMHLAHLIGEDKCSVYGQDISQKSTEFLRINLILNGLIHSLHNIIQGNTISEPSHIDEGHLMKFDYVVSNPPFKTDFSNIVSSLNADSNNRFFAGIPKVPAKQKDKMPIYLVFIQHILASLNDNGKAAIVVPTGFCTNSEAGIASKVREYIVDNNYLRGVIHMPANIFANTGTSVSILFIDKNKKDERVILMNASELGEDRKVDGYQKRELSVEERHTIINTFLNRIEIDKFSVVINLDEIIKNNYMIKAGQYFSQTFAETPINYNERMEELTNDLSLLFKNSKELEDKIKKYSEVLGYEIQ
ncbi:HsdM family class I SAM-dependent methyltransferase [Priestia megaterium]|uniref:HsdM family class I SAM-dependent methyltransferase n=1 Tax=Priestia megaterium TaxID=1404 RepID=UPI001FB30E38|nr:class I SAM-dependent DNA methyltransferase [Priestia megaterium]